MLVLITRERKWFVGLSLVHVSWATFLSLGIGFSFPNRCVRMYVTCRYKGKSYRATVEIVRTADRVAEFCRRTCIKLECCPNLFGPRMVLERCSENCSVLTKTKYSEWRSYAVGVLQWLFRFATAWGILVAIRWILYHSQGQPPLLFNSAHVVVLFLSMLFREEEESTCRPSCRRPRQHRGGCEETRQEEEEKEAAVCPQEETLLRLCGQHTCRVSSGNFTPINTSNTLEKLKLSSTIQLKKPRIQ